VVAPDGAEDVASEVWMSVIQCHPSDDGDAAKPSKGGLGQPDEVTPAPDDSSGQAKGQEADHSPPGQADKDREPGAGTMKPKPPKETARPTARP
jgi:hypothetical protein